MKRTSWILFALCLPLLFCGPALARQQAGAYVEGYGGGNLVPSAKSSDNQGSFNMTFKPALQFGAVVGWEIGPDNLLGGEGRVELEYSHRNNRLDQVEFVEGKVPGGGGLTVDSLLLNSYYVYHDKSIWFPYFGIGAGAARIAADGMKVMGQPLSSDTDLVFAYQVGTGVDLAVTDRVTLDLGYRFFGCSQPKFGESNGQKFKIDYFSHSVIVGVRLGF